MRTEQGCWTSTRGWTPRPIGGLGGSAQLVLLFAGSAAIRRPEILDEIRAAYPEAHLLGCSTAGEIHGTEVLDDSVVFTAVRFDRTEVRGAGVVAASGPGSYEAAKRLASSLDPHGLVHVVVLSDGTRINGSELVRGLTDGLPESVTVTGGLSGDGGRFDETLVLWDGPPRPGSIAAVALYGPRLKVGYSSAGGWDPFGPEREITRSRGNVLYELDGRSALGLYKEYLGDHAADLPAAGLRFPLSLRTGENGHRVVRTILSVNEDDQSMTFAGDVPQKAVARLMKANFDRLIDGATKAAEASRRVIGCAPELAILISCVGRKLVLNQRIEEEVEGVREILGEPTVLTGFYSYGEISPFGPDGPCELHNQSMTITTLSEG